MIDQTIEFQISQYIDGTLGAAERSAVEMVLASDPTARVILNDYQKLSDQLQACQPVPAVNWYQLADRISSSITQQSVGQANRSEVAGRIGFWSTRLRIAAAVLITAGAGVVARHYLHHAPVAPVPTAQGDLAVSTPGAEAPTGPASVEISVGPSSTAMNNDPARYGEASRRPSRVAISPISPAPKNDSH